MLTAKTRDGTRISLLRTWSFSELQRLKEKEQFFCPVCNQSVVMKIGSQRRWHFAHRSSSHCGQSEQESDYHLAGKEALYVWLKKQNMPVSLEPYIQSIQQRPDLLLTAPYETPIEFQCSTISDAQFLNRTSNYVKHKLIPLWILGGNRFTRIGNHNYRLSRMDWLSLTDHNSSTIRVTPHILYFCPNSNQFAIMHHLLPFSTRTILANVIFIHSERYSYSFRLQSNREGNKKVLFTQWFAAKKSVRTLGIRFRTRELQYIQTMLQTHGRSFLLFPAEAGIPSNYLYWIQTPAYIWQTWLLLQWVHPLSSGQSFRFHEVYDSFQKLVQRKIFSLRTFPLVKHSHYSFALMDYLNQLVRIGLLRKIGKSTFMRMENISLPTSTNEALYLDADIQQKFLTTDVQ